MANNYHDATGVLMLDRVTPVISALFGAFHLDGRYPGNGKAYIARLAEVNDPQWSDVLDDLMALAAQLDLPAPADAEGEDGEDRDTELSMPALIDLIAPHFGADQNQDLANLIEHHPFEGSADLDALFLIATCFDDGHHLVAIQLEGCWRCSRSRLFEFGGHGCFISRELTVSSESTHALQLGEELRTAILAGDLAAASNRIANETLALLAAITDDQVRARLRRAVADRLLTDPSLTAAG